MTRRRSFGSVTEVRRGHKYVIRWMQNTPQGRRRKSKTIYGTYREACRELALREVEHGEETRKPTFGEVYRLWYEPWLERRVETGKLAASTAENYRKSWRNHVGPAFSDRAVDSVAPLEFQSWLLDVPGGVSHIIIVLMRKLCSISADYGGVDVLFAGGRSYERPETTGGRASRVLTSAEALDWLHALRGSVVEAPFILACFGGLRTSEALAVRSEDVELVERVAAVDVSKQVKPVLREVTRQLKTESSKRVSVVPHVAAVRLAEIAERSESGWLADVGDGLPYSRSMFGRTWSASEKQLGLEHIPFANLRNSWRTITETEVRLPWDLAETLMGHRLPGVTGQHYLRASREQIVAWADDAFSGSIWDI